MTEFFAAANTEHGFKSLFGTLFSPETHEKLYILKGGPGSGKSTLLKKIGATAEAKGYETEYFACSSDTDSLDAVTIPALGISVLDGTAPHTTDPLYPGAVERIVNLGEAFDFAGLRKHRAEIVTLCRAKGEAYRTAYRFLAAAGRMTHEREELISTVFLAGKADGAVKRLAATLKKAERGAERQRYLSAIGTKGYISLDTLRKKAKKIIAVTERHGAEFLFMHRLHAALAHETIAMTVCKTPLTDSQIEAIYLEGEGLLFAVMSEDAAQKADKIISSGRFISREGLAAKRARIRFAEKCMKALSEGALTALCEAGKYHEKLEAIYGRHMDFSRIDEVTEGLLSEIFSE